ncbi:hypothetical protein BCL90_3491 [Pedobacter alluvionis]|uniref:Uncharacterized protein n=1 Tax=Pedobacter alluvionis TaxID=475253 RepID=A0A497XY77_9SPHI|nr:hypothetical protein BCL90_3491 [Pedobacter alluvionis]
MDTLLLVDKSVLALVINKTQFTGASSNDGSGFFMGIINYSNFSEKATS